MVFITNGKTTCFSLWRPSSGFDNFLSKRVLYNIPRGLVILSETLLARKLSKPEDGCYRPKHVIFPFANKHHYLAIYL